MENEKNQCSKCRHFKSYYTKGIRHYFKADIGRCIESQSNVGGGDCCDKFAELLCCKRPSPTLLERINILFAQMSEIRSLIEDELKE